MTPTELDELMTSLTAFNYQYVDAGSKMNRAVMQVMSAIEQQYAWEYEENQKAIAFAKKAYDKESAEIQAEEEGIAKMRGEM